MRKTKKRTIKQLLEYTLDFIKEEEKKEKSNFLTHGLCRLWLSMQSDNKIISKELKLLFIHLEQNAPKKVKSKCNKPYNQCYYWEPGRWYWRKKWLHEQIKQQP